MLFLDFGQADIRLHIFHRHSAALIQMTVDQEQEYDC